MAKKINTNDPNLRKVVENLTMQALDDETLENIDGGLSKGDALRITGAITQVAGFALCMAGLKNTFDNKKRSDELASEIFDENGNLKVSESSEEYKEWSSLQNTFNAMSVSGGALMGIGTQIIISGFDCDKD